MLNTMIMTTTTTTKITRAMIMKTVIMTNTAMETKANTAIMLNFLETLLLKLVFAYRALHEHRFNSPFRCQQNFASMRTELPLFLLR
jgi:hypothetical protein